jgi:uncharacterized protein (TIGR02466 family)
MIVDNIDCFPILVRRVRSFLTEEQCNQIVQTIDKSIFKQHGALSGNAGSSDYLSLEHGLNSLDEAEKLFPIKNRLDEVLDSYTKDTGAQNVKLSNSWMNIQYKESQLLNHVHPFSVLSGALYIKVDSNSSTINFQNPNPFVDFFDVTEFTKYNFRNMWLQAKMGDLIIFPSWMRHGSNDVNKSDERIVLSFNTMYKKVNV